MIRREDYREYFEVLEIPETSSTREVLRAYYRLRKLFSTESIVTLPLVNEFPEEQRDEILRQVEEAYQKLTEMFTKVASCAGPDGHQAGALDNDLMIEIAESYFGGDAICRIRKKLRVEFHDIELATKIRSMHIKNIEEENYSALPEEIFLRGYLKSIARHLNLDPDKVVGDYMDRYGEWQKQKAKDTVL